MRTLPIALLCCASTACGTGSLEWVERPEDFDLSEPIRFQQLDEPVVRRPRPPELAPPLRIATWNLEVFGASKASRPALVAEVASIITRYDLVAVQEIKDITGSAANVLRDAVTEQNPSFQMVLSERSGLQDDDRTSREQYAYFYDASKIAAVGNGVVFDDQAHDRFQREPFVARFEFFDRGVEVAFANIHTKPTAAVEEIDALAEVADWIRLREPGIAGIVILGDFNAGCSYASPTELDALRIRQEEFVWLVSDDADTNVASSACAYDRIVATTDVVGMFGEVGVDVGFEDPDVSDHWPVWASVAP